MIFFVLLIAAASAAPGLLQSALSNPAVFTKLFSEYGVAQDRHYLAQERRLRAGLFRQTLKEVVEHNDVDEDWEMELNMFADMTEEEKSGYTGFNASQALESLGDVEDAVFPQYLSNPSSKDWRGVAVTKVKDQKSCGSCWIFSGFGALEGHYKTQGSILKSFSEQEGLNCIQRNGCKGGFMGKVFDWLKKSNRVGAMKDTPYSGRQGSCSSNSKNALIAFRVTGYSNARGDSGHVTALATKGPLSVGYSVASDFFKYKNGIYRRSSCSGGGHAVTSVGYTADYFRMKNSWGANWGESGYFRIGRGNVCGITNMGFAPTFQSTGQTDNGTDEGGDDGGDDGDDDGGDDDNNKTCTDNHSRCSEWANRNPSECSENWNYMKSNCQKSCQQCGCQDMSPKCGEWKGKGYCGSGSYVDYMNFVCRKSCDKCGKDDGGDGGDCPEGFKKCPDGSCVHQHWNC